MTATAHEERAQEAACSPPSPINDYGNDNDNGSMALSHLRDALRAFQASGKAFELLRPAQQAATTSSTSTARRCKTLVILDSSFNPPTVAHMQMATSALRDLQTQRGIAAKLKGGLDSTTAASDIRLLLLLAVNNADKEAKPASFEERLLMMQAFAGDIQRAWQDAQSQSQPQTQQQDKHDVPIDIGLTTWPYFNDKSDAIAASPDYDFSPAQATSDPAEQTPVTEQVVLAGYDTLIRIFNPKYYKPAASEQDATTTKRTTQTPMQAALDPFFARAHLRITMRTDADWGDREAQMAYVDGLLRGDELESIGGRKEWAKRVEVVEGLVSEDGLVLSSTEAREAVKTRDWKKLEQLVPQGVADLIEHGDVTW